jgi:Mannosyltransferase (PIG-V)
MVGRGRLQEAAVSPQGSSVGLAEALPYCVRVFVALRIGLAILALVGSAVVLPNDSTGVPGWPPPPAQNGAVSTVVTAFERWDALWFLRIADQGYKELDGSAAFFPLFPLAVRFVSAAVGGHPLLAALLVSHLSFLGALILLYMLSAEEFNEDIARRAVLLLAVFPTAFFFFAPYSESLFLFLCLGSFRSARRGKWVTAGIFGALAAATRSIGIVLAAALAVEAFMHLRTRSRGRLVQLSYRLSAAGLTVAGAGAYLLYWRLRASDWLIPFGEQANWLREPSWPWNTLIDGTTAAWRYVGVYPGGFHLLDWILILPMLVCAAWVIRKRLAPYAVYAIGSLLVPLSFVFEGRPLMSLSRFVLPIFPLFWAAASWTARYRTREVWVGVSAAGLGLMTVLFVNWYWVI